ncbi:MAG: DUF2027 domain-containing protein [Odoribacter sp.]|nr:DUF2027 domain-containing protein [Odoribacter sp.]
MQAKVGDTVRFLNSVGGGKVTRVEGQIAYVDEDGFETPVLLRECVVVAQGDSFYKVEKKMPSPAAVPATATPKKHDSPSVTSALPPVVETPEGEKLNIVLGFEPADSRRLSETTFDAYLVNDSNYALWIIVATRDSSEKWEVRYRGLVEAQMQEFLFELTTTDLPGIKRIAVQALPFKISAPYVLKQPVAYEQRLDTTKFARLHCFVENPYFDSKVLALDIVKDDRVQGRIKTVDADELARGLREKQTIDRRAPRKVFRKTDVDPSQPLEIDLHASELLDTTAGLSKADILNYQVDTFRRVMDENLRYPGREIIFIHGKGEGVLRQALMKELNHRYKGHDVSDASFREYGFGATKVVIRRVK